MQTPNRLYMVLHPNHSLIASQLDPTAFAKHYTQGSTRYFEGKLVFAEIDPTYRNEYFDIPGIFEQMIPHEDGRPKATKFIRSYRVLEHIDVSAIGKLYLGNSFGDLVEFDSAEYDYKDRGDEMRIILEVNPLKMMVLSKYNFQEFGAYITDPTQTKGAPVMFYTQLEFHVDEFLHEFESNPFIRTYVPGIHPARLRESILEVRNKPGKNIKGLSLDCPFDRISYKVLRHGFMFSGQNGSKYFPLIPLSEIEKKYYKFWKTM